MIKKKAIKSYNFLLTEYKTLDANCMHNWLLISNRYINRKGCLKKENRSIPSILLFSPYTFVFSMGTRGADHERFYFVIEPFYSFFLFLFYSLFLY